MPGKGKMNGSLGTCGGTVMKESILGAAVLRPLAGG